MTESQQRENLITVITEKVQAIRKRDGITPEAKKPREMSGTAFGEEKVHGISLMHSTEDQSPWNDLNHMTIPDLKALSRHLSTA